MAQPRLRWRARAGCAARGGAGSAGRAARPSRALQPARSRCAAAGWGGAWTRRPRSARPATPRRPRSPSNVSSCARESYVGGPCSRSEPRRGRPAPAAAPPRRSWLASQCRGGGARRTSVTYGQFRFWNLVVTGRVDESRTLDFPSTNDVERAAHAGVKVDTIYLIVGCRWERKLAPSAPPPLVRGSSTCRGRLASTRARRAFVSWAMSPHGPWLPITSERTIRACQVLRRLLPSPSLGTLTSPTRHPRTLTPPRPPPTLRTSRPSPRTCSCVRIPNPARRGCRPSWRRS